jgi:hypothetical protein
MDAPTISVKCKRKDGSTEWLEQTEDESQITRFPLASFFSSPEGYLEAATAPRDKYREERFAKRPRF